MRGFSETHIDQSKVVFIDWELLQADVFLQSRGIGALKDIKTCFALNNLIHLFCITHRNTVIKQPQINEICFIVLWLYNPNYKNVKRTEYSKFLIIQVKAVKCYSMLKHITDFCKYMLILNFMLITVARLGPLWNAQMHLTGIFHRHRHCEHFLLLNMVETSGLKRLILLAYAPSWLLLCSSQGQTFL